MWHHLYVKLKKNYTTEFIYKIETDSETQRMNFWLPGGKDGKERQGVWG